MKGEENESVTSASGEMSTEAVAVVLERFAEELAFVTPGSGDGLLPVNALLMDLEAIPFLHASGPMADAVEIARRWVDGVLDGDGLFTAAVVQNLHAWHGWCIDHLVARETRQPVVPLPEQWRVAAAPTPPIAAAPAPATPSAPPAAAPASVPAPAPAAAVDDGTPTFTLRLPGDLELLREFHSESLELLRAMEQSVLDLESGSATPEVVNSIFRAFHTFKGSAGFLQLDAMRDFAHQLESLLDEVRSGRLAVGRGVVAAILAGADVLARCIAQVGAQVSGSEPLQPIRLPAAPVLALVRKALAGEEPELAAAPTPVATSATSASAERAPLAATPGPSKGGADRADSFVRLDASKLDTLVNLVGELVITQAFVLESSDVRAAEDLELGYAVRKLVRITRELQQNAMSMRMVPVSGLFRKMSRLVRDLAASLGKQARLVMQGEETELDRQLVERMTDPMIHMIRNALDHGVELPEVRAAAGKDPVATVRLSASHAHGGILLQISDDGRGIDTAALKARAIEKHLIDAGRELTTDEALALIFLPGFTTAAAVTDVSGRGVGMDVVKGHIDALRGHVDIRTALGTGTTFAIRLPLTLAQIDGFLIRVADERYLLPSAAVRECFRPIPGSVSTIHERGEMVDVRGQQLPILRLARCLGLKGAAAGPEAGIIVRLETGAGERALLVDEVLGKHEVIIKNLGDAFVGQTLVAGGAILSDGRVALILDAEALARLPAGYSQRPMGALA